MINRLIFLSGVLSLGLFSPLPNALADSVSKGTGNFDNPLPGILPDLPTECDLRSSACDLLTNLANGILPDNCQATIDPWNPGASSLLCTVPCGSLLPGLSGQVSCSRDRISGTWECRDLFGQPFTGCFNTTPDNPYVCAYWGDTCSLEYINGAWNAAAQINFQDLQARCQLSCQQGNCNGSVSINYGHLTAHANCQNGQISGSVTIDDLCGNRFNFNLNNGVPSLGLSCNVNSCEIDFSTILGSCPTLDLRAVQSCSGNCFGVQLSPDGSCYAYCIWNW